MAASSGGNFAMLLTERGGLLVFGLNLYGQLDMGDRVGSAQPTLLGRVGPVVGDAAGELAGGGEALEALAEVEELWATLAQIAAPQAPFNGEALVMVAAGIGFAVCVTDSGTVYAAGSNQFGELGLATHLLREGGRRRVWRRPSPDGRVRRVPHGGADAGGAGVGLWRGARRPERQSHSAHPAHLYDVIDVYE